MAGTYKCPKCASETTVDEGDAPLCVPCGETMVIVGASLVSEKCEEPEAMPVAPENIDAYRTGLAEIEEAKDDADQQEREYLRAKEYASKAKKKLEAAETALREIVQRVADRLRPRPLFEAADHHTDQELIALLAAEHVEVTPETVEGWTDAERADARAWALAMRTEQPRLMPACLWAPVAALGALPSEPDADPEPPPDDATVAADVPAPPEPQHWYPRAVGGSGAS